MCGGGRNENPQGGAYGDLNAQIEELQAQLDAANATPPQDPAITILQMQQAEAERLRQEAAAQREQERTDFEDRLNNAYTVGRDQARSYFTNEGLNPDDYGAQLTAALNAARAGVPTLDSSPASYFSDLGQRVYGELQSGQRNRALRDLDSFSRPGFANNLIENTADDATLSAILAERESEATEYLRRLLDRGVITNTGFSAGQRDLEGQRAGANSRLQELGLSELERGRGSLRDIAATARSNAGNLRLGDNFDPFSVQGDINSSITDFFANMANNIRGLTPNDLFSTSGLANIAGAAQGAQNGAFDPGAVAGLFGNNDNEEEDDEEEDQVFGAF